MRPFMTYSDEQLKRWAAEPPKGHVVPQWDTIIKELAAEVIKLRERLAAADKLAKAAYELGDDTAEWLATEALEDVLQGIIQARDKYDGTKK